MKKWLILLTIPFIFVGSLWAGNMGGGGGVGSKKIMFYTSISHSGYNGNIHIEVSGFDNITESDSVTKNTYNDQTNFYLFSGTKYDTYPSAGMPSIFESACYIGMDILAKTYVKWRILDSSGTAISDWIAGEAAKGL